MWNFGLIVLGGNTLCKTLAINIYVSTAPLNFLYK